MPEDTMVKDCSHALKRLRERLEVSQEKLAQALGCAARSVSRWENRQSEVSCVFLRNIQRLEQVTEKLYRLFEEEEAKRWLFSPHKKFDMKRPIDVIIQGDAGRVLDILNRLEEGVHV